MKKGLTVLLCAGLLAQLLFVVGCTSQKEPGTAKDIGPATDIGTEPDAGMAADMLLDKMTLEQKVAQMIMLSLRTWEGEDNGVTELGHYPALAEALRRHQYGGVILFGANIADTQQTVRLIGDLQANNALGGDAKETGAIPYLVAADQEGGYVSRLSMGTRGTGSMAIGATGDNAVQNARDIGRVFGEELSALGLNVNLGPCVDVITDLTDFGMSTRVFSDDPQTVSALAAAFGEGVDSSNVVTTYKHFPGAGDGSDYPTAIRLTEEELRAEGLAAYSAVIENGAEMLMTAATTFPLIDDEQLMADGVTKGYYPATLSPKLVKEILRDELGFDGVVITDALEMDQFITEPDSGKALFPGEPHSAEHDVLVAEKAVNAGCDILLMPRDLISGEAVRYFDDYIAGIVTLVEEGRISEERIDESVRRILELKERHGLLDADANGKEIETNIEAALRTVGSPAHHAVEKDTAAQAVTLLKSDGVLPLPGEAKRIVIIGRTEYDNTPITYALGELMKDGTIDNARIVNRITGETAGEGSDTEIVIDRYYDYADGGTLVYSQELTETIGKADAVVCLCAVFEGIGELQDDNPVIAGVSRALDEAHEAGAKFILLSANLPVDAARFQEADAIICAYQSSGVGVDPTERTKGSENVGAYNANIPAAIRAIFGASDLPGKLPIDIPVLEKSADGAWGYGDGILYQRGYSAVG